MLFFYLHRNYLLPNSISYHHMPIINSKYSIRIPDQKPARFCRWRDCPLRHNGKDAYEGIKMKACARCATVRYCSKTCQKEDWVKHKKTCGVVQNIDVSRWIETYRWLFKWAAMEALQVYTDPTKIHEHVLQIHLVAIDRALENLATPFYIFGANIAPHSHTSGEGSLKIKEEGGIGQLMIEFNCITQCGTLVLLIERMELGVEEKEKVPVHVKDGYRHFEQWAEVLKGVANGRIEMDEIMCFLGGRREP